MMLVKWPKLKIITFLQMMSLHGFALTQANCL